MNRENYLKIIHEKNYNNETQYCQSNVKESHIHVLVDIKDMQKSISKITSRINLLNNEITTRDITELEVINLLQNNNGISHNLKGEPVLALNYNCLFDYFIEQNRISSSELITLYRIEGENQKGIVGYLSDLGRDLSEDFYWDSQTQPSPLEDSYLKSVFGCHSGVNFNEYSKTWFFAFQSKGDLLKWFNEDISKEIISRSNNKAIISEYIIPKHDTISTDTQSIFKIKNAKQLKTTNFEIFIESESQKIQEILMKKNKNKHKINIKLN